MNKTVGLLAAVVFACGGITASETAQAAATRGSPPMFTQGAPASTIRVGTTADGKTVVSLVGSKFAFVWDPATGVTSPTDPQIADNTSPTQGIGVVVKKNPGSSARTIPANGDGTATLPSDLEAGNYDLTIRMPGGMAMPGSSQARTMQRGAVIRLSFVKDDAGIEDMTANTQKHAISTDGMTPVDPNNPNCVLKTRTKSNRCNE